MLIDNTAVMKVAVYWL